MAITGKHVFHPFNLAVAQGKVPQWSKVNKFGSITGVGTTLTPVTDAGVYQMPTAATSLELVSSDNINDIPAGTGARTVRVFGLTSWSTGEVYEDVALNGTTAVPLTNDFLRVYRMQVIESGAYATDTTPSHNSTITLRVAGAGATWAQIGVNGTTGLSQSEIACYSVPAGKRAFIPSVEIDVSSSKTADIILFVRENADTIAAPFSALQAKLDLHSVQNHTRVQRDLPLGPFEGPCDIVVKAASTSTTSDVEVEFEILLQDWPKS